MVAGSNPSIPIITEDEKENFVKTHALMRDKIARHDYIENLDNLAMNGGFYDIFRDQSKIANTIKLIDGFEDGNADQWSNNEIVSQTNVVISGDYTGEITANDSTAEPVLDFSDTSNSLTSTLRVGSDTGNSSDSVTYKVNRSDGTTILYLRFEDSNGEFFVRFSGETILSSWSADTNYKVKLDPDFGNDEADIYVNGDLKASSVPFDSSASSFSGISILNDTRYSGKERNVYIDDVGEEVKDINNVSIQTLSTGDNDGKVELKSGETKGYIVEKTDLSSGDDDFSNPPASVVINQDADIPEDEDIKYTVKDVNGSGTTKIFTQEEVGEVLGLGDFTGFVVEVKTEYSSADGNDTPTHRSQDFYFEEGS